MTFKMLCRHASPAKGFLTRLTEDFLLQSCFVSYTNTKDGRRHVVFNHHLFVWQSIVKRHKAK
jgi:hypothetical protein